MTIISAFSLAVDDMSRSQVLQNMTMILAVTLAIEENVCHECQAIKYVTIVPTVSLAVEDNVTNSGPLST